MSAWHLKALSKLWLPTLVCIFVLVPVQARQQALPNELIYLIEADSIELGDVFALEVSGKNYLSFGDFIKVLDIPIQVDTAAGSAQGWFRSDSNTISIAKDPAEQGWFVLTYGNARRIVDINDVAHIGDELFVSERTLETLFRLQLEINERDLKVTVSSSVPLPVTDKIRRKADISQFERKDRISNTPSLPRIEQDYQLYSHPFVDIQANVSSNSDGTRGNISALGNGDLAYMTGEYFISANDEDGLGSARLVLTREDDSGQILGDTGITRVSIGDVRSVGILRQRNSSNEIGIRFSNTPLNQIADFDTKDFQGFSQPGWDIELYQNGVLIDAVSVQSDGKYEFLEVPLYFGKNDFELRFFGPQGQRRSEFEQVPVVTPKRFKENWIYDISLTQQNASLFQTNSDQTREQDFQVSASLQKSLTDNTVFKTGLTTVTLEDNTKHTLLPLHLDWFLENGLLSFDFVHDFNGGQRYLTNFNYTLGTHGLRIENTIYQNFAPDIDLNNNQSMRNQIRMSGPMFSVAGLSGSYSASFTRSEIEDLSTTDTFGINNSLYMRGLTISNTMNLAKIKGELPGSDFEFGNGILQMDKRFSNFNWRSRIGYLIEPDAEINTFSNSLLWNYSDQLSAEFTHSYAPQTQKHSGSIVLNWLTDYATLGMSLNSDSNGNISGSLSAKLSMGHDPISDDYRFVNRRLAATGGFAAFLFEDTNLNGVFDEGERPIPNASVQAIHSRGRAITDEQGIAFLAGLAKNRATDIELDVGSLEDPFWLPSREGVSINPRPGIVHPIEIPIVVGGEIEGSVYIRDESGNAREGSYKEVQLLDTEGNVVDSVVSGFDGYYLFTQVLPGQYQIKVADAELARNQLKVKAPLQVDVTPENSLLLGANLDLVPEHFAQAWKIQIGEYRSRAVAGVMARALRRTLIENDIRTSIQLGRVNGVFTFRTKTAFDRDTALSLCQVFNANDLPCRLLQIEA